MSPNDPHQQFQRQLRNKQEERATNPGELGDKEKETWFHYGSEFEDLIGY